MSNTEKITIRPATVQDVKSISEIVKKAFEQYCKAIKIQTIEALSEQEDDIKKELLTKQIYIACIDDMPVGSIRISLELKRAFISRFSILPQYQGAGIGGKLLAYVDEQLIHQKVTSVELYSTTENERLKNFYLAHGYQIISTDNTRGYQRGLYHKEYE